MQELQVFQQRRKKILSNISLFSGNMELYTTILRGSNKIIVTDGGGMHRSIEERWFLALHCMKVY